MNSRTHRLALVGLFAGVASFVIVGTSRGQDENPPINDEVQHGSQLTEEEIEAAASESSVLDMTASILGDSFASDANSRIGGDVTARPALPFAEQLSIAGSQLSDDVSYSLNQLLRPTAGGHAPDELERIVGGDNRSRVTNTTGAPYKAICQVNITFPNGKRFNGTAEFVGPRVLLSNGHVVYSRANGGWAKSIRVVPGKNGSSEPYGSAYASKLYALTPWINGQETPDYDMSWIVLPDRTLYNRVGYAFGYKTANDSELKTTTVNMAGYHGDKKGEMWFEYGGGNQQVYPLRFHHFLDSIAGSSGSPVWQYYPSNGYRYIVGVHCAESTVSAFNLATRMTSSNFNSTNNIKKQFP